MTERAQSTIPPPVAALAQYLWESDQPPRALHQASGYALEIPESSQAGAAAKELPRERSGELPFGAIILYPRFLVFLACGPRGQWSTLQEPLPPPAPVPLAKGAYLHVPEAERSKLLQPLLEPGSIAIPLDQITAAKASRRFEMPGIELSTRDGTVLIGPHPDSTKVPRRTMVSRFSRWEPRLLGLLRSLLADRSPQA